MICTIHRGSFGWNLQAARLLQPARYLYLQTNAFKERRRDDYAMQANVATLTDRDMRDIAAYLSSLPPVRGVFPLDPEKVAKGRARVEALACATCHLPTFGATGDIPRLAGQTPGYTRAQLEAFRAGKRPHGTAPAAALTGDDADAIAQYLASLAP